MKKIFLIVAIAGLMVSCKPSEKNYKAAYDKAHEAALRRAEAERMSATGDKLEQLHGPKIEIVKGDTIYVTPDLTSPIGETAPGETGKVGIAVAKYSMPTNAKRHTEDIKKEFPNAFVATDGQENYYVTIQRVESLQDAVDPIRVFIAGHPDFRYIGLYDRPMAVFISPK